MSRATESHRHDGPTVAQVHRALALDPRVAAMRADRQDSFRRVMRYLLAHADWGTLVSRPSRARIAEATGLCERTVTSRVKDAVALGYNTIIELGTTPRIRAGRCYPAPDPYADQGNRAQVYQLHIPAELAAQILQPYDEQEGVAQPHVLAGQPRTCAPSPRTESTGGENSSTHVVPTATPTRARGTSCHNDQTAKAEKKKSSPHRRPAGRGLWRARLEQVSAVWRLLPTELTELLAAHEAPRIADAIAVELEHRTVAELGERITRHWDYWKFKLVAGLVRSPAAIAFRLIRRDFDDCPDVRCEDRWQLDRAAPCKACTLKGEQIRAARQAARTAPHNTPRHPATTHRPEPTHRAASGPQHPAPPTPAADRCDPNPEYLTERQALRKRLGAAAVRARAGRQAIA